MSDKLVVEIDSKDAEVAMRNLDRLTTAAEQMGKAFENTKGATSALRELRLMLTSIKGQGSSLDELKNSIQSLNSTADSLKRSFAGSVGQLGRIFKNEMAELKSIVQETGLGIGKAAVDSLSDGIASPESKRKVVGAMRAQIAEMQAAYEQELAKGVKFSGRDLFDFKSWGLNIGADAKQAIRDGLVKDAAPIPVEKILGLDKSQVVKSAKDSAAVFQEAYSVEMAQGRLLFKNFEQALGLDKSQVVKSAKDSATVFQEAYSVEMAQGRLLFKNFEQALGLDKSQVVKSAKDSAAVFREAYNAEMRSTQRSAMPITKVSRIDAADATYASAMAQMKDYYKELELGTNSGVASAGKMSNAFKQLTIDGNNVHSMARGLASGFNLLWLTWGNLVPLFIGAAISNGFVQTAKTGMQVAHTLETIAILGGNTAEEMAALNIELDRIGNSGPFGPLAVAESMKVLSLAGLKANEILAVTQDVLNFSIAGTTDLKTAADALVSISTAFGMGAAGFGRVSDVVSKAAAESKTSVESFANAMKTASVINKQYGVSLEDTATGIAALSQLGIEGTAAGTALRNMYADLSGRSIQVSKVLKAQGIEMRDTITGGFRPMLEVVAELNTKLQGLDAIGQKNLLQAILSERGAKGIVELLQLINTEAKNAGAGMSNALQQMRKSIEESYGFAAISAAKLSQTAESQFKSVKATLETSMNDAYKSVEPTLRLIADGLRKAFSSPEFISGLSQMVTMTAQLALSFVELTRFIVEHQGAIAAAAAAYSLISLAIRHKAATMAASTAATTADTTATLANNAAKAGAVGALGTLGRLIPGLGTAITLAAGAWMAYDFWQSKSKDTAAAASDLYNNNIIKNLNDEANRLRELNDLRAKGLTLSEAQQLLNDQNSREKGIAPASDAVAEAIRNEYSAIQKLNKAKAEQARQTTKEGAHRVIAAENALAVAKKATSTAKVQEAKVISDLADAQARVVQERKRDAGFLAAEAKKREELFKSGTKGFKLGAGNSAGNSAERRTYQDTKIAIDNRLAEIVKGYNKEKEEARNAAADEKAMLDSKHRNGLISEGEYQSQLFNVTKESEQKQLAQIKSSRDEYSAIYQGRIKELADQWLEAKSRPTKNEADRKAQQDDLNKIADAWENLGNTATTEIEKMDSDARQLASKGMRDLAIASDNAAGAIYKLRESERKYWADDKATLDKAKALDAVNAKYRNLNDSVFSLDEASRAYEVAAAESTAKHEAHIEELTNSLNVAELAAQAFWDGAIGRGGFDTGEFARWLELKKVATDTGNAIADAKTKAGMSASAAGQIAFDRKRKEQNTKLASDLSDAVMTGLFDGAEAGKKKLRDVLVAELRKPIKMVVDLVINTVVGGIMGGIGGAAQAGQGWAGGANTVQTGFSALNGSISSTIGDAFSKFAGSSVGQSLGLSNAQAIAGNNPSAYVPPGGGLTATGQQMSQALGVVGDTLAGYAMGSMARSLISNGYSAGKGMDTFQKVGIAVGSAIGGPVAGAIIGAGAGVFNQLFGRKLKDSGIQGTFGGQSGFEGESFEFYKGGLLRSDKTKTKPLDEEVRKELGDAFGAMRAEVGTFATLLGLETDRLAGFTTSIKISTKGLDEKAAQEKIQEALVTANNELAQQVIGTWTNTTYTASEYAKEGEKAIDTLRRLATSLGTVNAIWENLGFTLYEASLAGADAASKMADAFGGLENMAAVTGTYYENFYSEAEKTANVTRSVSDALAAVGLAMPATRDDFRALVESQIALGEGGTKAVAALLGVSGAFASVTENMKRLQSDTANLQIELLRAQGNTAGADAAQRAIDTTGLTEAEVALYDYNTALRAQIGAIKEAAALRRSLIGLESGFAGGGFSRQYRAEDAAGTVSGLLADVGIQKDAGMLAQKMLSATSGEVEGYFREIWNVLETDEARQKLVDVTGVMVDLAQGAGSAAEAFQKQQDALQTLAQDAARLFSARNSAGDLMDRISGAMGKQGTFGAQRESELWGALGNTSDAEKQVELASQLTDLVLSRQQLEVQNAERMLSFGRSLRDYVDGLKLGSLSPLTNAEKLAEASTQYNEMLGKAQGGDADAQAGLQGIASTYLDLARTYFAGNEQFSAIFGSVTSSLDALGVSSMSEAQQQLSLGTQSLGELQRLYSITETAYGSLNAQYETAVSELSAAQDALVLQSDSLDQLKDIAGLLSGLPAEIAVRLPAINTEATTYLPLAMPVQQGDNAALIAELQALREEVADLRAENRQDAQMVAGATVASASASASQIADATAKAAYTTTVKQGAVLI